MVRSKTPNSQHDCPTSAEATWTNPAPLTAHPVSSTVAQVGNSEKQPWNFLSDGVAFCCSCRSLETQRRKTELCVPSTSLRRFEGCLWGTPKVKGRQSRPRPIGRGLAEVGVAPAVPAWREASALCEKLDLPWLLPLSCLDAYPTPATTRSYPPHRTTPRSRGHVARLNLHGTISPGTRCCWISIDAEDVGGRVGRGPPPGTARPVQAFRECASSDCARNY